MPNEYKGFAASRRGALHGVKRRWLLDANKQERAKEPFSGLTEKRPGAQQQFMIEPRACTGAQYDGYVVRVPARMHGESRQSRTCVTRLVSHTCAHACMHRSLAARA